MSIATIQSRFEKTTTFDSTSGTESAELSLSIERAKNGMLSATLLCTVVRSTGTKLSKETFGGALAFPFRWRLTPMYTEMGGKNIDRRIVETARAQGIRWLEEYRQMMEDQPISSQMQAIAAARTQICVRGYGSPQQEVTPLAVQPTERKSRCFSAWVFQIQGDSDLYLIEVNERSQCVFSKT